MFAKPSIWKSLLAAAVLAACGAADAWARLPEFIHRLRPAREPKTAARIEAWRSRLDEPLRERFNFAWCFVDVDVLGRCEYIAHSALGGPEDLSAESWARVSAVVAPDVPPDCRHYETLCVNRRNAVDGDDCWDRDQDTEFKILEAITARLGENPDATGVVVLYTDLPPCRSCMGVIEEFKRRYPRIRVAVLYK